MSNENEELIVKYLSNELSKQERLRVEKQLDTSDSFRQLYESYAFIWNKVSPGTKQFSTTDAHWESLSRSLDLKQSPPLSFKPWLAAACLLIACFTFFFFYETDQKTYLTNRGETKELTLPDGSTVRLNHTTKLIAFNQLDDSVRVVTLRGEAFFSITKNKKPFIVQTQNASIRVLGTQFNVRSSENRTKLMVEEGKVAFRSLSNNATQILVKGQQSECINTDAPSSIETAETNSTWYKGYLRFDAIPFSECITELENTYDIQITLLAPSLANLPITAKFTKKQSAEIILNSLSQSLGYTLEKRPDGSYKITK